MKVTKMASLGLNDSAEDHRTLLCIEEGDIEIFVIEHRDNSMPIDHWYFKEGTGDYERYCEMAQKPRYEVVIPEVIEESPDLLSFIEALFVGKVDQHPLRFGAPIPGLLDNPERDRD